VRLELNLCKGDLQSFSTCMVGSSRSPCDEERRERGRVRGTRMSTSMAILQGLRTFLLSQTFIAITSPFALGKLQNNSSLCFYSHSSLARPSPPFPRLQLRSMISLPGRWKMSERVSLGR